MMGNILRQRNRRGFVLVTALGVLAVIMTAAFMAASSAQQTFTMTVERQRDRRISDHITVVAEVLPRLLSNPGATSSVRTVLLVSGNPKDPAAVTVSATLGLAANAELIRPALEFLEGDELARVEAKRSDGQGPSRRSTFLVNSRGLRSSPILIREERL
jgi:hypothetical protein